MEFETYADVIDAYESDNMGYETLTDYINKQNIKIKEIDMDPLGDLERIINSKAYGGGVGHLLEPTQTYHQYHDFTAPMTVGAMVDNMYNRGGRVNFRSAGAVKAAHGNAAAKKGPVERPSNDRRDDGPPSITNPYVPPVVKKLPVQLSDSDVNPMFQHLITPAAAVKTDFLKKHGWYNNPFTFKGSPLMKAGAEAGGYGLDYDKLIGGELTMGEVLEGMSGGTYDAFDPNVQKTLGEQILGNVDFGKTFQKNWSTDVVEPTIKDGKIDIDETKLEVDEMPVKPKDVLEIKDGGRVGMFMGGDPLTGQALSIYESMNSYGFSDAEIASALQQQGLYTPPGSGTPTPDPTPTPTPGQGGGQGGGDGGGITELQKTYTRETAPPQKFIGDPTAQLTGRGRLDPMGSGFEETLKSVTAQNTNPLLDRDALAKKAFFQEVYQDPREISFFDKTKKTFGSLKDKFFQPKIKGTLGDRLLAQSQGITSKIPSLTNMLGNLRSPFNPTSPTYNAALPMQLNFLEGITGSKIGGTSKDGLTITEGLDMIGRDPNSGHLKYGPGSVLAGKNVISGFGSNDYETALDKYISRMLRYENRTKFQEAKLQQARDELAALQAKTEQEYIDSGTQAEVQALQKRIDRGDFDSTSGIPDRDRGSVTKESAAKTSKVGGGGYTKSDTTRESRRGGQYGFRDGGVASMFTRRR